MQFLGRQARETVLKVKTHLMTEDTDCSGSGTIIFFRAFGKYTIE